MKLLRFALVCLLALPSVAWSLEFPDTPAGRMAQLYLASFNSGNADTIRAFEAGNRSASALEKRPLDQRIPRVMGLISQIGTVEPNEVVESSDYELVLLVYAEKVQMWAQMTFTLEGEPPHKLDTVAIRPAAAPGKGDPIDDWESFGDLLSQIREDAEVPALAAAVVVGDEIAELAVVGVRIAGGDDTVGQNEPFHIGSVSKAVTATMIGRLVQDGALRWDLTLAEAFPDMMVHGDYAGVTLAQVLHHRAGIPAFTATEQEVEARYAAMSGTPTDKRLAFAGEILKRAPTSAVGDFAYSNAGYGIAAAIAEKATGMSWEKLVQEIVFAGCGMTTAGFGWPSTPKHPNAPRGHFDGMRPREFGEYTLPAYIAPAGDIHMSVGDLARFARSHLAGMRGKGGVVDAETFSYLHTPVPGDGDDRYACGWVIEDREKTGAVHWHNGSAGTFYALVELYPESNRAIVVLANVGVTPGDMVARRVRDSVLARATAASEHAE